MDSTKRIIKFQNYDLKKSIGSFWLVIALVNIFASTLTLYSDSNTKIGPFISNDSAMSIAGSNIMAIVIFFIVYGILTYHEDFALALSFGVTRKDFYSSVIFNNILVALVFAIIQSSLQVVDRYIIEYLGYKPMVDFGIFNTSTDNILFIILSLTVLFFTIISITNLLGVLQFKFGYKLWIGLGLMLFIGLGESFAKLMIEFWGMFSNLFMGSGMVRTLTQLVIISICYSLGYMFIKKANIKK